jgi:hypothetical protein
MSGLLLIGLFLIVTIISFKTDDERKKRFKI